MKVGVLFSVPPTVKIAGGEKKYVYRLYRRIILNEMRKKSQPMPCSIVYAC
jgi:hypothetical protein